MSKEDIHKLEWVIDGVTYKFLDARKIAEGCNYDIVRTPGGDEKIIYSKDFKRPEEEIVYESGENGEEDELNKIMEMVSEANEGAGPENGESSLEIDADFFIDAGGYIRDYGVVVAEKENKVVGALTFSGDGYLDRGVVTRTERKNSNSDVRPISENLMRLTLSVLIAKYDCNRITSEPSSERGKNYIESNGLREVGEGKTGMYGKKLFELDPKIIEKAKEYMENLPENSELNAELVNSLRNHIDGTINEVAREIKEETRLKTGENIVRR